MWRPERWGGIVAMLAGLLLSLLFAPGLLAADLPSGIKKCKRDDSLNECILKESKTAIKNLAKGDKAFKIPVLDPTYIEKIEVVDGPGKSVSLNFTLNKLYIHGLRNAELTKSQLDLKKKQIVWTFKVKEIKFLSDYELNGKFLLVPIRGKGKANIVLVEPVMSFNVDYDLVNKAGTNRMIIKKSEIKYDVKKITMNFENLFNGDKALSDNLNQMLNDNWMEMNKQVGPGVAQALAQVITNILTRIGNSTPFERFFLP